MANVHGSTGNYLIISDLQIPAEHPKALEFCKRLKKEYRVSDDHVLCVGDEIDEMWAGQYTYDPNILYGPSGELKLVRERLKAWYDTFPQMLLCESNHGQRWLRRATAYGIPHELMKKYAEIFGAPDGWKWKRQWEFKGKYPFIMNHGTRYSGRQPFVTAPFLEGVSTVFGHIHSAPGVAHISTSTRVLWGMCVGSLIDVASLHFNYERDNKFHPVLGAGIVLDGGKTPLFIPFS